MGAIELTQKNNWCSAIEFYTNVEATGRSSSGCEANIYKDVWFKFRASTSFIGIDFQPGGLGRGEAEFVLQDSSGTELICDGGFDGIVYEDLSVGSWYYLLVGGDANNADGTFGLCINDQPSYDYRAGAIELTQKNSWCSAVESYTNVEATGRSSSGCEANIYKDVWFKFRASTSFIGIDFQPGGLGRGEAEFVLQDSSGTELICDGGFDGIVYEDLSVGSWYYLLVGGDANNADGTFGLCINDQPSYDHKSGAIELKDLGKWCSELAQYSNELAVTHGQSGTCDSRNYHDVWFKFHAGDTIANISLLTGDIGGSVETEGTLRKPHVIVFDNAGNQVACKSSSNRDIHLHITGLTIHDVYYISVGNDTGNSSSRGSFSLCVDSEIGDIPDVMEFQALRDLYEQTGGDSTWTSNVGWPIDWNTTTSINEISGWHGITVVNGDITNIDLANNGLINNLPGTIGNMQNLKALNLSNNNLSGSIPDHWSNLPGIEQVFLQNNVISGRLPLWIATSWTGIRKLDISGNFIRGKLPEDIHALVKLESFVTSNNRLTGSIPGGFTQLSNLQELKLQENNFLHFPNFNSHLNPDSIDVNISNNYIPQADIDANINVNGAIFNTFIFIPQKTPNGQIGDEIEIQALQDLYEDTRENGPWTLETGWPTDWANMTSVDQLIGWHGITVANGDIVNISLDDNNLVGSLPGSIGYLVSLEHLSLAYNGIHGELLFESNLLTSLKNLILTNNNLSGELDFLSRLTGLQNIDLGFNQFTGEIPWDLDRLTGLTSLLLNNNNLTGKVSFRITQFPVLETLRIDNNLFTGIIPYLSGSNVSLIKADHNQFERIPNYTVHPNATNLRIHIHNNSLYFTHIEANLNGVDSYIFSEFSYKPQDSPNELRKITFTTQEELVISSDRTGGTNTHYQWEEWDGVKWNEIPGATLANYTIVPTYKDHLRRLRCRMWNDWVSGLILYSEKIQLEQEQLDPIPLDFSVQALYNGQITSMKWWTKRPAAIFDNDFRGIYLFDYDEKYQMKDAVWGVENGTRVFTVSNNYRVTNLVYDPNGNIRSLRRYNGVSGTINDFEYNYESNTNKLADIPYHSTYHYNKIGQLNRELGAAGRDKYIQYGVTGKVIAVYAEGSIDPATGEATFVEASKKVSYTYDDRGFRLTSKNHETGITTWYIRDASGNVMSTYEEKEGGTDLVQKEVPLYGSGKIGTYYADQDGSVAYELTDHLGNVRAVMSRRNVTFTATIEDTGIVGLENPRVEEMQYFLNLEATELPNAGALNHTPGGSYATYLDGSATKTIGPAITLQVKAGDKVSMKAFGKYEDQTSYNAPLGIADLAGALTSTYLGLNGQENALQLTDIFTSSLTGFANDGAATTRPLAFLNFIYFDNNFSVIDAQKVQIGATAAFNTGQEAMVEFDKLENAVDITRPGYIYIYLSNHTPASRAWFDDLTITITEDIVTQATDYYPFGSVMRRVNTPNSYFEGQGKDEEQDFGQYYRYGFQGQFSEEDSETGWNSFELRMYDPVIGRFNTMDPAKQFYSPYVAFGNNPVVGFDPTGGICPSCPEGSQYDQYRNSDQAFAYNSDVGVYNDFMNIVVLGSRDYPLQVNYGGSIVSDLQLSQMSAKLADLEALYATGELVQSASEMMLFFETGGVSGSSGGQATKLAARMTAPKLVTPYSLRVTEIIGGNPSSRTVFDYMKAFAAGGPKAVTSIDVISINGVKYVLNGHHRLEAAVRTGNNIRITEWLEADLYMFGYKNADEVITSYANTAGQRNKLNSKILRGSK